MTKPTCDRCNAPVTVHEIDGSMFCDHHRAEELRLREYAKVRLYAEGPDKTIFGLPIEIVELPDAPTEVDVIPIRIDHRVPPGEVWLCHGDNPPVPFGKLPNLEKPE